jgi:hypothetical protein
MSSASINQLYRYYWLRADLMRDKFYGSFENSSEYNIDHHTYMGFWYASLYSVIEGYQKLNLHNSSINLLLTSPNLEALKKFRHSVTGFHKTYFNSSLIGSFINSSTSVAWVNNLHFSLGKYLMEEINRNR